MERKYETIVIYQGTLSEDESKKESVKVEKYLSEHSTFEKTDFWGRKNLGSVIRKQRSGYFFLFNYTAQTPALAGLDKMLKMDERVVRYMTCIRNPKTEANAAKKLKAATMPAVQIEDIDAR